MTGPTRVENPKPGVKNRMVQTAWRIRAARIVALCFAISCGALTAGAFTAADADAIFEAHTKAFYRVTNGVAWHAKSTDGGKADFWTQAEQLEMALDAYERTKNPQQLGMFTKLFRGFVTDHGRTWERNSFNDDIMWMVIACTRAHLLTGNAEFRDVARTNFDLCFARATSTNLGGGIWWKTDNRSKNACVNGPGALAAFLLGQATGESAYFCRDGYLPPGRESGDGGGFNGIGVRWIARYMKDRAEEATFEPWLQKNAEAAWQARRTSDNLSWCRWPEPTPEDERYSWGCSSAVVILQVVRLPHEPQSSQ